MEEERARQEKALMDRKRAEQERLRKEKEAEAARLDQETKKMEDEAARLEKETRKMEEEMARMKKEKQKVEEQAKSVAKKKAVVPRKKIKALDDKKSRVLKSVPQVKETATPKFDGIPPAEIANSNKKLNNFRFDNQRS